MLNERVVSGMRPTGRLHLGHYYGVLKNWIKLQEQYPCFFFIADWHALTTHYQSSEIISDSIWNIIIDWLSAGIDEKKSTIFIQSHIPEHAELFLLLSMHTSLNWLKHIPSYKDQVKKQEGLQTYGFLGYPLLQAADILMYQAKYVPVGMDQIPHIEITRKIARNLNQLYKQKIHSQNLYEKESIFIEPEALLTDIPNFPGLDGQKMSKSYNNTLGLREDAKSIRKKIQIMQTDPARIYKKDPGNPDVCLVWKFHCIFSDENIQLVINQNCRNAVIGCMECKQLLVESILKKQQPIMERAQIYLDKPQLLRSIISDGCNKARKIAKKTLKTIRKIVGI